MDSVERPANGQPASEDGQTPAGEDSSLAAFSELRTLLFGPDQKELRRIQERLDDPKLHAEDVSRILPEAISLSSHPESGLAQALGPTIEESFKLSIKRDPQTLVDVISPIMGPAIRKSISDALQRMIQSLNQTLEYGFSPKGLRWRLEAFRTGKSFAEVVLLNTLQFRVEQVFLIHRKTGLLLQHVSADPGSSGDADTISGMFSAIQDFVRDSFGGGEGQALDQARVGELAIWVEQAPEFIVAAVIRGNALQTLRSTLQETSEKLQVDFRQQLEAFAGDAAPFELTRPSLEACLLKADREERAAVPEAPKKKSFVPWIIAAAIVGAIGVWIVISYRASRRWTAYLDRLSAEPGIVVTGSGKRDGKWYVQGLRDPMAIDPDELATRSGVPAQALSSRWEPYDSFVPDFALARARATLAPPATVSLRVDHGLLHGSGTATGAWISEARRLTPLVPGLSAFADDELTQSDRPEVVLRDAQASMKPPPTVSLTFTNGVLTASGSAGRGWVAGARQLALSVPGVTGYEDARLVDIDARNWAAEVNRIEMMTVEFASKKADVLPGQDRVLADVAHSIRKLSQLSMANGPAFHVIIRAERTATETPPGLGWRRVERLKVELAYLGAPSSVLVAEVRDAAASAGEYVTFQVAASDTPSAVKANP